MFISDGIANLLSWLYDLWPSYGGSIILLTVVIMTVMAPLTIRQTRSMLEMQRLQPELKKLRAKHGNDRERMNQEMMALYQANGVNPLGGCLPILVQLPIFLFLFQVVRGLTRRITDIGLAVGEATTAAGDGGARVLPEFADRTFNPDFLSDGSQLSQDLRESTEMTSFGLDLSQSASSALGDSILTGVPYLLLVIGVGVTTWFQQKQIQGRNKGAEINPQQQAIMKILPFMLPIFSFGFPAALVVYWFVSNLFRVGQQAFITRQIYGKHDSEREIVKPEVVEPATSDNQTTRKQTGARAGSGGSTHGSRNPLSTPPPKKRKKPPAAQAKPAAKRSNERKEPQSRPTSKRVTPKKNTPPPEPEPSRRRRDRKRNK